MFSQTTRSRIAFAVIPALVVPFLGALIYYNLYLGMPTGKTLYGITKAFTLIWPFAAVACCQ